MSIKSRREVKVCSKFTGKGSGCSYLKNCLYFTNFTADKLCNDCHKFYNTGEMIHNQGQLDEFVKDLGKKGVLIGVVSS